MYKCAKVISTPLHSAHEDAQHRHTHILGAKHNNAAAHTHVQFGGQKTLKTVLMCVSNPLRALKGNQLLINPPCTWQHTGPAPEQPFTMR
jgi:hypothetical protein